MRLKNRTGNLIDLEPLKIEPSPVDILQGEIALSLDPQFKDQRNRTVAQALNMVVRQRTLGSGFYDPELKRYVKPMTLVQAARNIDHRHRMLTGFD